MSDMACTRVECSLARRKCRLVVECCSLAVVWFEGESPRCRCSNHQSGQVVTRGPMLPISAAKTYALWKCAWCRSSANARARPLAASAARASWQGTCGGQLPAVGRDALIRARGVRLRVGGQERVVASQRRFRKLRLMSGSQEDNVESGDFTVEVAGVRRSPNSPN